MSDELVTHTPGPWSCEKIWDIPETRVHADVDGKTMALAGCFTMRKAGEREANARLIAAAPELLAIVKHLLGLPALLCECGTQTCRTTIARAIVAKVEGRS